MNGSRILILLLLLAAGAIGVFALRPPPPPQEAQVAPQPPPPPAAVRILTAARDLPVGTLLADGDLQVVEIRTPAPEGALEATAAGPADFRGSLVRRYVPRGQALMREDIINPGERGFLAAVLRPGHRAISIGVDAQTGAGGLVTPGDIVDLVLVQNFGEAAPARRVLAETVLTQLRVLAIDQQVAQGAAAGASLIGRVARTMTLEVTADGAERVAVAEQLGRLAVTVRPAIEVEEESRKGATVFGGDVSGFLGNIASQPAPSRMTIIQGGESQEVTFR